MLIIYVPNGMLRRYGLQRHKGFVEPTTMVRVTGERVLIPNVVTIVSRLRYYRKHGEFMATGWR